MYPFPFTAQAKTFSVAVTAAASGSLQLQGLGNTIRFVNAGPNVAYASIGVGTQAATVPSATPGSATATCTPIPPGDVTLTIPSRANPATNTTPTPLEISLICRATQTAQVDIQVGEGQ